MHHDASTDSLQSTTRTHARTVSCATGCPRHISCREFVPSGMPCFSPHHSAPVSRISIDNSYRIMQKAHGLYCLYAFRIGDIVRRQCGKPLTGSFREPSMPRCLRLYIEGIHQGTILSFFSISSIRWQVDFVNSI